MRRYQPPPILYIRGGNMATPADVLVFLHKEILDKEDELNTLEIQI